MSRDLVVTVPASKWFDWLAEGDCAGDNHLTENRYYFSIPRFPKRVPYLHKTEIDATGTIETFTPRHPTRVYVVCNGRLRGYAPLVHIVTRIPAHRLRPYIFLERRGDAVAVTIPQRIKGFRGFRYRWWDQDDEVTFPDWKKL